MPGLRRPGRTEVADAGLRKEPLQGNSHVATERAVVDRRLAAVRSGGGVLHQMGLVEGDHAVEIRPQPVGQLFESLPVAVKIVAEQGVRREQDARIGGDGFRRLESCLVDDTERESNGTAVAFGIGDKLVPRRNMHVLPATLGQFVVHEGVDFAAFADARAIAVPMPFTRPVRENHAGCLAGVDHVFDLQIRDSSFDDDLGGQVVAIGDIGRFDARHRRALDHVGRVGQRAPDHGFLHAIGSKHRPFLDIDRLRHMGRFKLAYIISNRSSVFRKSKAAQVCMASRCRGSFLCCVSRTRFIAAISSSGPIRARWCQSSHCWLLIGMLGGG